MTHTEARPAAFAEHPAMRFAAAVIEVTRELVRTVPAPRGAPFFGLDGEVGYDLQALDAFWGEGIFRKYEFALELGSGLGGRARWIAARSGCRVMGVEPRPAVSAAARVLNRRASLDAQVWFAAGRLDALPVRDRFFTHVWALQAGGELADVVILNEAYRVLRPGAALALQLVAAADEPRFLAALRAARFADIEVREARLLEPAHTWRLARQRLLGRAPAAAAWLAAESPPGTLPHRRIFARRPA